MNIEERIKNDLHSFLVKVEEGRKEHSPAMNVEAYLIDMFAKQMATGVLLEISLHDKELIEKIEETTAQKFDEFKVTEYPNYSDFRDTRQVYIAGQMHIMIEIKQLIDKLKAK
jgi:hypothetical protein